MIYSAETDIIPLISSLVQGLQPYGEINEVKIHFEAEASYLKVEYQPFNLIQSFTHLICQIINLVPHQSEIHVRLRTCQKQQLVYLEVENNGINLMLLKEITFQSIYSFTSRPLQSGTVYHLILPLNRTISTSNTVEPKNAFTNELPKFYAEVRKRLRSHFTQAEMLMASLSHSRPKEAAFLQKINALISANMEDEQFDSAALSKAMAMSRTQLFRRLKPLIRQAPAHYIKTIRLQRAKELLETTDLTVGEVAFKTGFQSQSHFTKVFLQQYDLLPSAFRRKQRDATKE